MNIQTKKQKGRPWLWGTIIVYCLFAGSTLGFVFYASSQKVDLVSEDYYQQELQYQQHIESIHRTHNSTESVLWELSNNGSTINFHFPSTAQGTISFYRPSSSTLDKIFTIDPKSDGVQRIAVNELKSGYWKIKIKWEYNGNTYYKETDLTL